MAILGTAFVAVGIACAIFLIADVVYGRGAHRRGDHRHHRGYGGLWWALPLVRRATPDD